MRLIKLELQRITRRRGSFFGVMGFAAVIALIALVSGGEQTESLWGNALGIPLVFGSTIVGALAGSYDTSQGTMRYLVLTGTPRWWLVVLRVPALIATIALIAIPAALIGGIAMANGGLSIEVIARVVAGTFLGSVIWGIVAMAVGTMLRSNGAGIAVALVLFLVGVLVTEFVRDKVSQTIGDYLLPNVTGVVATFHTNADGSEPWTVGLVAASIAVIAWLAAIIGVAVLRAERDEY